MSKLPDLANQRLLVWRDSVAAGDDGDAPHEIVLDIGANDSFQSIVARILATNYLPSIAGGHATWIVELGSRPLAVVAQQWPTVRYLVDPVQDICSIAGSAGQPHLYFTYWCQADPELVFESLRNGRPLPSKYT